MRLTLRRRFTLVLVTFSLVVTAAVGFLSWLIAKRALEDQLEEQLVYVAGAAAETGLQSALVLALEPGDDTLFAWTSTHQKLLSLRRYVDGAYIVDAEGRALVTDAEADSIPIGTPLRFLEPHTAEIEEARTVGSATTPTFEYEGRPYKYGFVQLTCASCPPDALGRTSLAVLAVLMRADFLEPVAALRRTLLLAALFTTLLAAGLASLLAAGVIEPLERLSRSALRIGRGRMRDPVGPEAGVEVGQLARAMERMRAAVVERDEQLRLMVAQVAHEIRNPLGGLELFAAAAADADDPAERRRLIGRIRGEVATLNNIISEFLMFARPVRVIPDLIDLRAPLQEAADLVEGEVRARGGSFEVDLPSEPLLARADPDHLKRAALNLLRNAAQAGRRVRMEAEWRNGEVVVSVLDDGPGIAGDRRERIFEPFVTDKEKGAGLGLAIVKKFVEAMGGRVEVAAADRPQYGSGARFSLYFQGFEDLPDTVREPVPGFEPQPSAAVEA
jgi:signal transduction histidine kinase